MYRRVFLYPVRNPGVVLSIVAQAMMEKSPIRLHLGLVYGKGFVTSEKVPEKSLGTKYFLMHCGEEHSKNHRRTLLFEENIDFHERDFHTRYQKLVRFPEGFLQEAHILLSRCGRQ